VVLSWNIISELCLRIIRVATNVAGANPASFSLALWFTGNKWRHSCPTTAVLMVFTHLSDGSRRSGSWSMPTTNYSHTLSHSLNVLLLCNDSFWSHDVYSPVYPRERSSSVTLLEGSSLFFLWRFYSSISWELFLIRCEVKGQGCRTCTDCKALWGTFVMCHIGLYEINCI